MPKDTVTRIAVIDARLCKPTQCQHECLKICPVNKMGSECVTVGQELAMISEALCTGCGLCVKACPFHAIQIIKNAGPIEEKLVYGYGDNAFRLYGVPLPRQGITGIIGENGCGKTTSVRLLSGALKPQKIPTVEARDFFSTRHTLAVKPQELTGASKEKTGALLKKIKSERMQELFKTFDLQELEEKPLNALSGGELQRVIVAAALARNEEILVLDEPFAFLDYAYRIRLVHYLKEKFSEKKVLVVDHDLSLLSYLCGQVYLLYGQSGAFGVCSQSYATERGINMFLEGFIAPENTRFRDQPLKYKPQPAETKKDVSFTIPQVKVKKGSFSVENPAEVKLFQGEVVGVVGRNGIGKSTIATRLAKTFPDGITLKKQLLEKTDEQVSTFLIAKDNFASSYINAMGLKRLEYHSVNNLSGGEHQKLEVYKALSQDKPVVILDEPTNMMDVNGRILLSKLLHDKANTCTTIMVIDHDLEFLLNTVDRLLVLEGTPGKHGSVKGVYAKEEGVALLLGDFGLSYRRDEATKRLKLNKQGSTKDRELKEKGKYVE